MSDAYVTDQRIFGGEMVPAFRTLKEMVFRPGPSDASAPFRPEVSLPAILPEITPPLPGVCEILAPVTEVLKRRRPFRKSKNGRREER